MTVRPVVDARHPEAAAIQAPYSSRIRIDVKALSHTGYHRAHNEDHFLVIRLGRTLDTLSTSLSAGHVPDHAEEVNFAMVVADGMGGHAAGEVASQMAISALVSLALGVPDWILRADAEYAAEIEDRARARVREVNAMLVERGAREPELCGMGTTLTIARSLGRDLFITHVGDSRAYLLRAGHLHRLTRDHSYAQMLVDAGMLAPEALASSRHRHVLTNVIGGSVNDVDVDTDWVQLADGDRILLCSDGLSDLVDDQGIADVLLAAPEPADACGRLVQRALDAGGRDNVTVIVAAYRLPEE